MLIGTLCFSFLAYSQSLAAETLSDTASKIAAKKMDLSFTEDWLSRWKDASLDSEARSTLCVRVGVWVSNLARKISSQDREKKLSELAAEVEHSLEPAGITAIEVLGLNYHWRHSW